jgi:hypothetical protein
MTWVLGLDWSMEGKRSWVGETFGPRLPFWLDVVTESEEVAVVVPDAAASTFAIHIIS